MNSLKIMLKKSISLTMLATQTFKEIQFSLQSKGQILMAVHQEKLLSEAVLRNTSFRLLVGNDLSEDISKANLSLHTHETDWDYIETGIKSLASLSANTSTKNLLLYNITKLGSISNEVDIKLRSINASNVVLLYLRDTLNKSAVKNDESINMMTLIAGKNEIIDQNLRNSSSVLGKISQSINYSTSFNNTKKLLDSRLRKLREKLEMIRQTLSEVGLNCNKDTHIRNITYKQPSSPFMQIEISIKTKSDNASILRVFKEDEVVTLAIENSYVSVNYQTADGSRQSITNWEIQVSDNQWKKIEISRLLNSSRLTVTSLRPFLSRTYGSFTSSDRLLSHVSTLKTTHLQIGNWGGSKLKSYVGCLADLIVNGDEKVMTPTNFSNVGICALGRNPEMRVLGASFSGRGFVKQSLDKFSLIGDFQIKLKFRSFNDDASILTIKGDQLNTLLTIQLKNGHVTLTMMPNRTTSFFLRSNSSQYNDGNWHLLHVSLIKENISLIVSNRTTQDKSVYHLRNNFFQDGKYLYLGGVNSNESFHYFAGCLSQFQVSIDGVLVNRTLNGLTTAGVNFDGCYQQVDRGLHFFKGGFSNVTTTSMLVTNIRFSFKTVIASGTILSYHHKKGSYIYITLFHGNLYVAVNDYVVYSTSETLNDHAYHYMQISLTDDRLEMNIDSGRLIESTPTKSLTLTLEDFLIFGYDVRNSGPMFPVQAGFVGDFRSFVMNDLDVLPSMFSSGTLLSLDGVVSPEAVQPTDLPTLPPTTESPPTCAPLLPLQFSHQIDWAGFRGSSLLVLTTSASDKKQLLAFFNINFVVTIEFRAFSPDAVVLFIWNGKITATQHIMLSLVDGHLIYEFDSGVGKVAVKTDQKYDDGKWYKVYLIRISQFGAMLVSETQEYHNSMNGNSYAVMKLDLPFYLGNIPEEANLVFQKKKGLQGCVRKLEFADTRRTFAMDFRRHRNENVTRNIRRCYVSVAPQVSFVSNGYALVNYNFTWHPSAIISITFRAHSLDGVLWYLKGTQTSLYLHMKQGVLELVEENDGTPHVLTAWLAVSSVWKNASYALCDGKINDVVVERVGDVFQLYVNTQMMAISKSLTSKNIRGMLFVAGVPDGPMGFIGCVRSFTYNGTSVNFASVWNSHEMIYGCSK